MDTSKKFLYINPDDTAGEVDGSRLIPVSSIEMMGMGDATSLEIAYKDAGSGDISVVDITVASGKGKEVMQAIVEDINFSKQSIIVVADKSNDEKCSPHIDLSTAPVLIEGGNNTAYFGSLQVSDGSFTLSNSESGVASIKDFDGVAVASVSTDGIGVSVTGTSTSSTRNEGFGYRKQVLEIGSGNDNNELTLGLGDSGAVIYVTPTNALNIKLPAVGTQVGWFCDFIIAENVNKAFTIQTNGQDGNDNITLFSNASDAVSADVGGTDHDILTFTNALAGSRIELINCVGGDAERWHAYVRSMNTVDASIA
tara:strand:+ start:564 stop:1496 length:933 start_codon:yes stop_codon:yes gene_type:complete